MQTFANNLAKTYIPAFIRGIFKKISWVFYRTSWKLR